MERGEQQKRGKGSMSEEIKDMLQAILGRLDEQGAEMKAVREAQQTTNERLNRIEEELKELKHEQKRQGRLIEKLAVRSFEMEGDIDELREKLG